MSGWRSKARLSRAEARAAFLEESARMWDEHTAWYDALAANPRPAGYVPIKDAPKGTCRIRVGDYRVICPVLDSDQVIIVARVTRRNESTYRDLD